MAKILVVEDEPTNLEVAIVILKNAGHTVGTATNGEEALECLRDEAFDLVLMDVLMPVMDGITATRAIRADPRLANVRIVGVTAKAANKDRQEMLDAGMEAVLIKPYRNKILRDTVSRLLEPSLAAD